MTRCLPALLVAFASVFPGCIPSNVVARDDRVVATRLEDLEFEPFGDAKLEGLYASESITGDAALSLRRVYYAFLPEGSYTAAALVDDGESLSFQTLSGIFRLEGGKLVLDDDDPVRIERAPGGYLRITAPNGAMILSAEGSL